MTWTVCIDPGHGGDNYGTCDATFIEKDITLMLAEELRETLKCLPIEVPMTRSGDWALIQEERGDISETVGADFVVSIHVNANSNPRAFGAEAYFWPGGSKGFALAARFAALGRCIFGKAKVIEAKISYGKWIEDPRAILRAHVAPTIVAECGFRTNEADKDLLCSAAGRASIVCALRGLVVRAWEIS